MTGHKEVQEWIVDTDSLAEIVEIAENPDVPNNVLAEHLIQHVWKRDIPRERAVKILRRERERLSNYQSVSLSKSSRAPRYMDLNDLELVSGHEFEHVLAEILSRIEGNATVTAASGDQGVDVVWFREGATVGIQAKAYDIDNPVGNSAVQEIFTGSVVRQSDYSIDVPAVVTTSRYTKGAREAAESSDVALYGRSHLSQWLSEAELDAEAMGNLLDDI